MDDVVAASAALGMALSEPAKLGGSDRSAVLRCRRPDGATVVVKSNPRSLTGAESAYRDLVSAVYPDLALTTIR